MDIEALENLPDRVHFSNGPIGTRSKLWSRVCQYISDADRARSCINQDPLLRGSEQHGDAFPEAPSFDLDDPHNFA